MIILVSKALSEINYYRPVRKINTKANLGKIWLISELNLKLKLGFTSLHLLIGPKDVPATAGEL